MRQQYRRVRTQGGHRPMQRRKPMTIDRRTFVQTATVLAVAATGTQAAQA
jgi:hypothetical protein